ncbi:MAG: hypothetical protein HXX13_04265 [Bacteroidetes bacterium]|nr:hypothetical protein [Bacteroidota bacterium]
MFKRILFRLITMSCILVILAGMEGCRKKTPDDVEVVPFVRLQEHQTLHSKLLNRDIHYAVLFPAEYENSATKFPVVFLLHGYGENETGWYKGGNVQYYIDQFASETIPMIYVMPEGFNSYYVNRFDGSFPYMDMFVNELVPHIDSICRTIKDAQHRAVMGYSMGGYGAFILPVKNPEVFKTSVVLSMSFRTDDQYKAEPQGVFNMQWGAIFGGSGTTGDQRITDYFKKYSPFHFLGTPGTPSINGLNLFIDCGDDEETLTITSDALHDTLRDLDIPHEFRVRNGAHTWGYWHSALPEALKYISYAVRQMQYPSEPASVDTCAEVPASRVVPGQLSGSNITYNVMLPSNYADISSDFPLFVMMHDRTAGQEVQDSQKLYSLLNCSMNSNRLPQSLLVEIPYQETPVTHDILQQVLEQVRSTYRVTSLKDQTILAGNARAGATAFELVPGFTDTFNSCLLFDADIPLNAVASNTDISYYLDISEKGNNYKGYHALYSSIRQLDVPYEYRVRQGIPGEQSLLNGLSDSFLFLAYHLKSTGI